MSVMTTTEQGTGAQDPDEARRRRLGEFLRAKRASLKPETVGLPSTARRRTPGLRREEVAVLANVGVTWYTWLEQGRDISVSSSILDAIAGALHLEGAELDYVYTLTGKTPPERTSAGEQVKETVIEVLDRLGEVPGYVADRHWNVLAVNDLSNYLFGLTPGSNCLVKFFTDEVYAARYPFREQAGRMMVSQFRQRASDFSSDAEFERIAQDLADRSPEFAALWAAHDLTPDPHLEVAYDHAVLGRLTFDSVVLSPIAGEDVMVFLYLARPDSAEAIRSIT